MADDKKKPANQEKGIEPGNEAQNVVDSAQNIIDTAMKEVAVKEGKEPMLGTVADNFKGLPMRELIAAPLLAAAESQLKLASVVWDFYQKIAFNTKADGTSDGTTRILKFDVNRPIEQGGEMKQMKQTIEAPFIGLVPIPALLIDRIDVDFQMEVSDTNVEKSSTTADVSTKIEARWWAVTAEVSGKVSTSRENTRSTNQTAKYHVHVSASQQPQTEGLSKLMDIMASCIEPIKVATTT